VTIFRNGRSFEPVAVKNLDIDELIEHLLGRRLEQMFPERSEKIGPAVLTLRDVVAPGLRHPISLDLHAVKSSASPAARQRRQRRDQGSGGVVPRDAGSITCAAGRSRHARGATRSVPGSPTVPMTANGRHLASAIFENFTAPSLPRITIGGMLSRSARWRSRPASRNIFEVSLDRLGSHAGKLSGAISRVAPRQVLGIERRSFWSRSRPVA